MPSLQLRVPQGVSKRLLEEVRRPGRREPVVFGFCRLANVPHRPLLLLREIEIPPESAYLPSGGHGARWSGAYTIELLNKALARQCGLFIFHAHGNKGQVRLSADDSSSANELLPKLQMAAPDCAHGSVVIGPDSCAGRILMPGDDSLREDLSLRLIGQAVTTWPWPNAAPEERRLFEKQPLAANPLVARILQASTVAVVGLSGGGSQTVPQLAALGIGEIIGIDNQRADASNRFASDEIGWLAAFFRLRKTTIAKLRAWGVNRRTNFTGVVAKVPERKALDALKRVDIIIGCVNNLHARSDLVEVAWRYCIPYVDIGLTLGPYPETGGEGGQRNVIAGNVFSAVPGGPCLWCTDFLTAAKLARETGGGDRSYLRGSNGRDAYVTPFNGLLASQAVNEALQLLTGYSTEPNRAAYRRFDGMSGTLVEWGVTRNPECHFCRNTLAAGDPIWR